MIKDEISQLFGIPVFDKPYSAYFNELNVSGKITARSTIDLCIVIIKAIESLERKESLNDLVDPISPEEKIKPRSSK